MTLPTRNGIEFTQAPMSSILHCDWVHCVAMSGPIIATASNDRTISIWKAGTGRLINQLDGHTGCVKCIDFSKDGSELVSGGGDRCVKVWKLKNSAATAVEFRSLLEHTNCVNAVRLSPNDKKIASASHDKTVIIWNAETGELLLTFRRHNGPLCCVAWSPDGKLVASAGDTEKQILVWDADTGMPIWTLSGGHSRFVYCVVFGATQNVLFSGGGDKDIVEWKLEQGEVAKVERRLEGHNNWVKSISLCPDNRCLASGSMDLTVRQWDADTGKCFKIFQGHKDEINSVAWSPDCRCILSGSDDRTLRIWADVKIVQVWLLSAYVLVLYVLADACIIF
jgi:WD40 repeat protein